MQNIHWLHLSSLTLSFDCYSPFGALQVIVILGAARLAQRFKNKSIMLAAVITPVIIGSALLYTIPRIKSNTGALLLGYYFLAFLFAGNPLIVSWMAANTGGQAKVSTRYDHSLSPLLSLCELFLEIRHDLRV